MSIISKLPKKVNEWLVTGQKLGLLTEKQKNDFIAKYISLRQAGRPEVKFRKPRTIMEDGGDKAIFQFIQENPSFECDDVAGEVDHCPHGLHETHGDEERRSAQDDDDRRNARS